MMERDKCREGKGQPMIQSTQLHLLHIMQAVLSETGTGVYSLVFGVLIVHWHQTLESH